MHYCGVVPMRGLLQAAMLQEVRDPEPPVRLAAVFFEPGTAAQLLSVLRGLGDSVIALSAPLGTPAEAGRACDARLERLGVTPERPDPESLRLAEGLRELGVFAGDGEVLEGQVPEGAFRPAAVFETNADGVFCALQGRRLPARRHPLGIQLRIAELEGDQVVDDGGNLWHRRIEEIDAIAAALCAHRYAVGHACWLGRPGEGVVVLPGTGLPERFPSQGVLPPVERLELP